MGPLLRASGLATFADERLISLKDLKLGEGKVIFCASDDDQFAQEDTAVGHGIFTRCFLDALARERGGAPTVPLTTLYDEVARDVTTMTSGEQEPVATFIPVKGAALPVLRKR